MATGLVLDPVFADHETGSGHPESPDRVLAIAEHLDKENLVERCTLIEPIEATSEAILRCHTSDHLQSLAREIDGTSGGAFDSGDTVYGPHSLDVALQACGSVVEATTLVGTGKLDNAFCVVRPPGHHATPDAAMGFCFFNNVAIAARHAQATLDIERVAIVDWDVHHGNGTQDIFYEDPSVFFFSTHQHPWYPGTGMVEETGKGEGEGSTLNVPLPAGSGSDEVGSAFRSRFLPAMKAFKPQLVMISAGFDSRRGDPLGLFQLLDEDFIELTRLLMEVATQSAGGRVVSVLEGGYALDGLSLATAAHLRTLLEG